MVCVWLIQSTTDELSWQDLITLAEICPEPMSIAKLCLTWPHAFTVHAFRETDITLLKDDALRGPGGGQSDVTLHLYASLDRCEGAQPTSTPESLHVLWCGPR